MMPNFKLVAFLSAVFTLCGLTAEAQQLSELGTDPAITKGTLPNGLRYYLVNNTTVKGRADFALVRKGFSDIEASRNSINKLPSYPKIDVCQFLADKGVGYTPDGYISYRDAGSVINFRDVPVFNESVADSTLLIFFDLVRTTSCPQTMIISGDIKKDQLADRMYVLSMTVPMLPSGGQDPDAKEWKASSELNYKTRVFDGLAEISMMVEAPRTPAEMMNTAVPLVTGRFATLLEDILSDRITREFKRNGIPVGSINLTHEDSGVRAGNEIYTVSVITDEKSAYEAARIVSDIIDEITCKGVDVAEFSAASAKLASKAAGRSTVISNGEYVEKCIRAELYGASIAPASVIDKYVAVSRLAPENELPLFNNYVYALLDPENTKTRVADSTDVTAVRADSSAFAEISSKSKLKIKSTVSEPITGGELWTFSNGMKVIFKNVNTPGRFEYGLMIKGGAPVAPEILGSFDVDGISGTDFRKIMQGNGITMTCSISESDLRLYGSAPSGKLQLLLKALTSLSGEKKFNRADYQYSTSCFNLKRRAGGPVPGEMLEDMMSPEYEYSHLADSLNERMPLRAEKYFNSQFSRMNDGVFVIVGDFDTATLQKTLSKCLTGFKCGKATSVRPIIRHDIRQGWYTKMSTGGNSVAMSISFNNPFSMDGYMAFKLASTALRREIVRGLAALGMYADIDEDVEFFPTETYTIKMVCRPCSTDGLPSSVRRQNAIDALNAMRRAVNGLSDASFSENTLKACKDELESRIASDCSTPSFLVDAAMIRYSVGRDIVTNWKSSIGRVSAADVTAILKKMENGARMEIVF